MSSNYEIPFNLPAHLGTEKNALIECLNGNRFSGSGPSIKLCEEKIRSILQIESTLLVPSCTAALEMSALLLNISPGDEVIMPSFTFVSTANAFALRGAKICFVDVDPTTMSAGFDQIAPAINAHTKALVTVPYNGVIRGMDQLVKMLDSKGIGLVEDAAQAWGAKYQGRPFGTWGTLGCFSFHETKNLHCGEGGCLVVQNKAMVNRAEILREKGTDRSRFLRGELDKYTWQDLGSSYLMSEFQGAFLLAQLNGEKDILSKRKLLWNRYLDNLQMLEKLWKIELQSIPDEVSHNAHLFYLKLSDGRQREKLKTFLSESGIQAAPHYQPLHDSPAGNKFGYFSGEDRHTTKDCLRLLRLPLFYNLEINQVDRVCEKIETFFKS